MGYHPLSAPRLASGGHLRKLGVWTLFGHGMRLAFDSWRHGRPRPIIGEGTEVRGYVESAGVARLDGHLEGSIHHDGLLIVGPKACLEARVQSSELIVAGLVQGDVDVEGRLELLPGAQLIGTLRCGHLVMHDLSLLPTKGNR